MNNFPVGNLADKSEETTPVFWAIEYFSMEWCRRVDIIWVCILIYCFLIFFTLSLSLQKRRTVSPHQLLSTSRYLIGHFRWQESPLPCSEPCLTKPASPKPRYLRIAVGTPRLPPGGTGREWVCLGLPFPVQVKTLFPPLPPDSRDRWSQRIPCFWIIDRAAVFFRSPPPPHFFMLFRRAMIMNG